MKINDIILREQDKVLVTHNIGNIPSCEVDAYCSKLLPELAEIFGKGKVALLPVRNGDTWTFTVVRKTKD